ncbi:MAG TPA: ABC transporter permease [Acidimicrobiales bacterium]|nr:ABC transporter permease [Acidimicrobiales bacterium]
MQDKRVRTVFDAVGFALVLLFVQQLLWPAPLGVIVRGMLIGGLTALISFGIALIYRANRIINFAQGDLGAAPAATAVLLIVGPGLPYFVALPLALVMALVLGLLVEFLIIRRFAKAPRLILTVATLFMSYALAGVALVLPRLFDITSPPQSFPSPFNFSFTIEPIVFRGNDVIAMIAVPVVILSLGAFFRFTSIGIAVRASAQSTERAALLGVPVKRIQTIVWVIATVMAALAIFLRAGIVGLPIGQILGPAILVRALAACVIGRMEKLGMIFVAAMGLGIIEQAIQWDTGRGLLIAPILFAIILVALLVQRRGITARTDMQSTWQAAKEVRGIPRELAKIPEVRLVRIGLSVLGGVLLLCAPLVLPASRVNLIGVIAIFGIIGVSLVVLTGWAGQVSLGQVAFMGIGGAVSASVSNRLGWDLSIALLLGGVAGAVVAVIIGLPALRIKGLFLAVTTLAFAAATSSFLLNQEFFSWWLPQDRISRPPLFGLIAVDTETRFYYLILAGLALALVAVQGIHESRTGRTLIGVRENERAAQTYGVNVITAKLTAFAISGFLAAFAGGLFVHQQQAFDSSSYVPEQSLAVFTMVVIGGLGSVPGAIIGALFVKGGDYFLPRQLGFFTSGLGALITLMVLPGGIGSLIYQARDGYLRLVAARRRILVPSLVADVRADSDKAHAPKAAFDFDLLTSEQPDALASPMAAVDPADPVGPTSSVLDELVDDDDQLATFGPPTNGSVKRRRRTAVRD